MHNLCLSIFKIELVMANKEEADYKRQTEYDQ
jgi:hypothetical protein